VIGKAALPYFACISEFALQPERKPPLMNCMAFSRVMSAESVRSKCRGRHDDEVMQLKTLRGDRGAEDIHEEGRIGIALQESPAHVSFGGDEECATSIEMFSGSELRGGMDTNGAQGLKPSTIVGALRHG